MKKKKNLKKRIVIISVCVVLVAAAVVTVLIVRRNTGKAYVSFVGEMNRAMWGSSESYYGTVYESAQQNITVGADKKIEQVFVKEGDKVKKGDKLFQYDTTLLQLTVEEKQLVVTNCENTLTTEQSRLTEYNNIIPYVEPETEAPTDPPAEETATEGATETGEETPAQEPAAEETEAEETDNEVHYTAQEKADKITAQELVIRRAQNALDSAKQNLTEAQEALDNATVTSKLDGTVTKIQSADSFDATSAFCTVIGDSGVTIKGYVDELNRSSLKAGDELSVNSYMSGGSTIAQVLTVNDYPAENRSGGSGNPNVSYYEFTAFMEDAEGFEIGEDVDIRKASEEEGADRIVIEKIYVRTDDQGAYVMKDVDGVLRRQDVRTKRSSMDDCVEIIEGLSEEDMIAFPYSSKSKEGNLTTTEQSTGLF